MSWWKTIGVIAENCRLVTITPAMAKEWLDKRNIHNRAETVFNTAKIRKAIEDGNWTVNGETIIFARNGNLIDGQHRLRAIAESGVSVNCYVIFDIGEETFTSIDTGRARRAGDVLSISGCQHYTVVAAATRLLYFHLRGATSLPKSSEAPSNEDILNLYREYPEIQNSAGFGHKFACPPSIMAFTHFITKQSESTLHDEFFSKLISGENISKGNPIYCLRERLLNNKRLGRVVDVYETIALIFKSFENYIHNRTAHSLRYQEGDKFPIIEGDVLFNSITKKPAWS